MARQFTDLEANYVLCVSTLLDPRFKKIPFTNPAQYQPAIERLSTEIQTLNQQNRPIATSTLSQQTCSSQLWSFVDSEAEKAQRNTQPLQSLPIIRSFLDLMILNRKESPLKWWQSNEESFFSLAPLAKRYLSIPATSVPSERLFSIDIRKTKQAQVKEC